MSFAAKQHKRQDTVTIRKASVAARNRQKNKMALGYANFTSPLTLVRNSSHTNPANATVSGSQMGPVLAAFFSVLGFSTVAIGAVGNLSILVAFIAVPKLRTHINYFLASLALSDFIQAVFYLPLEVEYHTRKMFIHSVAVCNFMYILFFLTFTSSSLNLLAVSAYRYLTIRLPFRSISITKSHVVVVILAIWLYSSLIAFLPLMGWRPMGTIVTKEDCYYMYEPSYAIFVMTANWLSPALLGFILYALMFRIAKAHADKIARSQVLSAAERRRGSVFKGAKTLSKIAVVYLVCWFPYVIEVLLVMSRFVKSNQIVHYFLVYLCYANSAINPFLYAGLCGDFREVLFRFYMRCRHPCSNFDLSVSTTDSSYSSRKNSALQKSTSFTNRQLETNV